MNPPNPKIQIRFVLFEKFLVAQVLWLNPDFVNEDTKNYRATNGVDISFTEDDLEMDTGTLMLAYPESNYAHDAFMEEFESNEQRDEYLEKYETALREWADSLKESKKKSKPLVDHVPGLQTF